MAPSKKTQALAALNKALTKLPEYLALSKLLGHNEAIDAVTVSEQEVQIKPTPNVTYEGITSIPKKNVKRAYLLDCCGTEYFEYFKSTKTTQELAQEIQDAVNNAPKEEEKLLTSYNISLYLSDILNWEKTDEVYPHMYQLAVGTFKVVNI
jgi:hypothetical protein